MTLSLVHSSSISVVVTHVIFFTFVSYYNVTALVVLLKTGWLTTSSSFSTDKFPSYVNYCHDYIWCIKHWQYIHVSVKSVIIDLGNGLLPIHCQPTTWISNNLLSAAPWHNIFQCGLNQNRTIFIPGNAFQNFLLKMITFCSGLIMLKIVIGTIKLPLVSSLLCPHNGYLRYRKGR